MTLVFVGVQSLRLIFQSILLVIYVLNFLDNFHAVECTTELFYDSRGVCRRASTRKRRLFFFFRDAAFCVLRLAPCWDDALLIARRRAAELVLTATSWSEMVLTDGPSYCCISVSE